MKLLHFNKSVGYIVTTVLSLCFLCACYFFIYLPANERRIEEQRFRTLQNIDRNIHEKIENSVSLLNNIISADRNANTKAYIDNFSKEKFMLSVPDREVNAYKNKAGKNVDSLVKVVVNDSISQVTIDLQKMSSKDSAVLRGSLKFSFMQFIEYMLPDAVFDEYIIFSKGKTVFQSFPSGISILKEDSLIKIKQGLGGSLVKNINSGGKEYKFFLHEVNFGGENRWILGGMLSTSRFYKERSQLPAGIIMLLIIVVVGMIVIFPWIKLYQMGSKDRLTLADGASTILVSMILMSLLFLCLFKYNKFIRIGASPDSKRTLASQINKNFYNETRRQYEFLKYYDSLRNKHNIQSDIVNLKKESIAYRDNSNVGTNTKSGITIKSLQDSLKNWNDVADIKQLYWLNSTGQEKFNWTEEANNAPHSNFSSRNYFKSIKENNAYYLDGDSTKKYFLDQVISWTTGVFTSIISMRSKDPDVYVAASSFSMSSVDNTLLPAGYSFAIIDNNGKVLYHSMKARNLNENVKSEFYDSASITSCINFRLESEFITDYYSKTYSVLVTPMENLPYNIIIFSDKSFQETRDIEVYSFTFSMLLVLFVYIVLQLGITFLVSSRRSFFKKQLFDTSWIGPKDFRHKEYLLSSALNLLIIIILVSCFPRTTFLQFLFLLLFAIIFISLFFNKLLAKRYLRINKINNYRYKMYAVKLLLVLLVIHYFIASCVLDNIIPITIIELAVISMGILFILYANSLSTGIRKLLPAKWKYINSFSLMVLSTLIITSGIPVAFFYISSYNFEQNLSIRYKQTDYANRLLEKPKLNLSFSNNGPSYNTTGLYYDSSYISEFPTVIPETGIHKNESMTIEKEKSLQLLSAFRLLMSDKAVKTDKLSVGGAADNSVTYHPGFFDTHPDSGINTYRQTGIKGRYLQLKSYAINYKIPAVFVKKNFFYYWIWLIAALVIFYFVILNIVKKLFCLNLPNLDIWKELDDKILTDNKLNKFLFVIGLPGAGKVHTILEKLKHKVINCNGEELIFNKANPEDNNVLLADLINIPDKGSEIGNDESWIEFTEETINPKYKVVIFNHFEYNIQDDFTNLAKLDMLEQLMLKSQCKVIILSTIHPINFLDSLNENSISNKRSDVSDKKNEASEKSGHDLERWHVLLGHYRIAIMPITKQVNNHKDFSNQLLRSETNYTHFLHDMQDVTLKIAHEIKVRNSDKKTDGLALKLQITAHYFYMYIWQSLTKEEKFLLYDLAEDNLVNSYDDYNLTILIAKGVIINSNGSPHLFNRGFRNFILTAIGSTEAMKIKERIKENGNWGNLRTPLIIVILAILAFLLISQQEAYSKLLTYVAALSAGIPLVLKILSLFDKNAPKTGS